MAEISGYTGQIDLATLAYSDVAYNFHSWSLDITGDVHDTTNFNSTGWRKQKRGLNGWSASAEVYTDSTNRLVPSDVGTEVTGRFYVNATAGYTGKCILNGIHPAVSVDAVETQSIDLAGSSDLSSF